MPTWLAAIVAVVSLLAFVYFTADLAVLLRGSRSVPPVVLRLARAGDARIDRGGVPHMLMSAGAAALFIAIPALWLIIRSSEMDPLGQVILAAGTIGAVAWIVVLRRMIRHWETELHGTDKI